MPNTNLTIDWIGNEALRLAHEKAAFIGTINREFDDSFQPGRGSAIRIRIPSQYTQTTGRVIDVQDGVEQSTSITVATQNSIGLRYNSQEFAQDLVNFQKLHLEPAMAQLVSYIDGACLSSCTAQTWNQVGTPGTAISTLIAAGAARAKLNQFLAPKDQNRRIQLDSVTMGGMVAGVAAYFNPSGAISEQYREGLVARTAMADYYENERIWNMANPAATNMSTWISTFTMAEGAVSFTVSSLTFIPVVGQVFTVGHASTNGMFSVHPETKAAYSNLQQFVVTSPTASTAGAQSTISFSPAIRITGARKNVGRADGSDILVSSLTSMMIRFEGGPSTTYPLALMYHKDAFTFATASLPLMDDAIRCVVKTYDGISLRVWEASDIRNDERLTRIDILWGVAAIRPQWACRLIGAGTT